MRTNRRSRKLAFLAIFLLAALFGGAVSLAAQPAGFVDSGGNHVILPQRPKRVISLVPALTEIILRLGAGECLQGITFHDTRSAETNGKTIVGGFLTPSPIRMMSLDPDLVLVSSIHRTVQAEFRGHPFPVLELESRSISDLYRNVRLLGEIFDKKATAEEVILELRGKLRLVERKIERIPGSARKRVVRFMGISHNRITTPGDDSFQNDFIRAAGGIPPRLGKQGNVVEMTVEEWKRFNPQVVYGCGADRDTAAKFLSQPGWNEVEAVRKGKILSFPCDLTCRSSVRSADFVAWLASTVYDDAFAMARNRVLREKHIGTRPVELPLDYVRSARIVETTIFDFPNKTLLIEFIEPQRVTSTLEGERRGIRAVGNHYFPPPCWSVGHRLGFEQWKNHALQVIGSPPGTSCFLFTGADMQNLSVQKAQFKDLQVYALVTAGVEGNAMRMSADEGLFYEPGTVNVLLLTNMRLTPRAMSRAIITATEAKTAAMQDLDIRSAAGLRSLQATGTGTDEVLVVEGRGGRIDNTGGHCKMGELIAKAVYAGVRDAVERQNGITNHRNVFRRLRERNIDLHGLTRECGACSDRDISGNILGQMENLLLQPRFASFLESAFALSDAFERGQVEDPGVFKTYCIGVAQEIAGDRNVRWIDRKTSETIPPVVGMALDALLNGLLSKAEREGGDVSQASPPERLSGPGVFSDR